MRISGQLSTEDSNTGKQHHQLSFTMMKAFMEGGAAGCAGEVASTTL